MFIRFKGYDSSTIKYSFIYVVINYRFLTPHVIRKERLLRRLHIFCATLRIIVLSRHVGVLHRQLRLRAGVRRATLHLIIGNY